MDLIKADEEEVFLRVTQMSCFSLVVSISAAEWIFSIRMNVSTYLSPGVLGLSNFS